VWGFESLLRHQQQSQSFRLLLLAQEVTRNRNPDAW
jgi:hypothetical protein